MDCSPSSSRKSRRGRFSSVVVQQNRAAVQYHYCCVTTASGDSCLHLARRIPAGQLSLYSSKSNQLQTSERSPTCCRCEPGVPTAESLAPRASSVERQAVARRHAVRRPLALSHGAGQTAAYRHQHFKALVTCPKSRCWRTGSSGTGVVRHRRTHGGVSIHRRPNALSPGAAHRCQQCSLSPMNCH